MRAASTPADRRSEKPAVVADVAAHVSCEHGIDLHWANGRQYSTDTRSRAESPASEAVQPVIDLSMIAALQHRGRAMSSSSRLLAWIEPGSGQEFEAAFVSAAMASRRRPATRRCASPDEARQWVEGEAAALGVPVEWTDQSPRTARVD